MNLPTIAPATPPVAAPARAADSMPAAAPAKGFAELVSGKGQNSAVKPAQEQVAPVAPKLASAAETLKVVEPGVGEDVPGAQGEPLAQAPEGVPDIVLPSDSAVAAPVKPVLPVTQPAAPAPISVEAPVEEAPVATEVAMALPNPAPSKPADALTVPSKGTKEGDKKPEDKGKIEVASDPLLALVTQQGDAPVAQVQLAPAVPVKPDAPQADAALAQAAMLQNGDPVVDPQDMSAELPDAIAAAGQGAARKVTTAATAGTTPGAVEQVAANDSKGTGPADALHGTGSAVAADLPVAGRTAAFHEIYAAQKPAVTSSDASPVVAARTGTMGRDMGVEIARSVSAGKEQLVVRMDPADMGRINIHMSFDRDGGLRAVVSADNQGTLDLMKREMGDLSRALSDAGVRADSQSFRFDTRSGDGGHPGQRGQQHAGTSGRQDGANSNDGDAIPDQQLAYRALRASGRVDMMA